MDQRAQTMALHEAYYQREYKTNTNPLSFLEIPLYRYRAEPKFYLSEIEDEYVYLASLEELNDPFECAPAITFDEVRSLRRKKIDFLQACYFLNEYSSISHIKETLKFKDEILSLDEFSKWLSAEMQKYGELYPSDSIATNYYNLGMGFVYRRDQLGRVACFSESNDSLPMWAYYANSHKGICIKYDFSLLDLLDTSNITIKNSLKKVWYSKKRFLDKDIVFSPFVKSYEWSHELEWRIYAKSDQKIIHTPCISEIYLGLNFDFNYLDPLVKILREKSRKIDLFIMKPKQDAYDLNVTRINY